jgi:hypothetical protein
MALVFQYGSNMSVSRLNGGDRLAGGAKFISIATTAERFELVFSVWSKSNNCAAADLMKSSTGRTVFGVLYEIPDFLLSRDTAKKNGRKSLDEIEGEGTNYVREMIDVVTKEGVAVRALTYVVKSRKENLKTSEAYVGHILVGLQEHCMPMEYRQYVRSRIVKNNEDLRDVLPVFTSDA